MASSWYVCRSSSLLLRSRALLFRRNNNTYYNKHSLFQHSSLQTLTRTPQHPSHFFFSRYRSLCSSTSTHGDDDGNVNAPARISQGESVKRKPPGRPHQKLNEHELHDNESSSTTHQHGVKASPGRIAHGELVERKSPGGGGGKPGKKSNEPDESCSTNAGRISQGEHVKKKPPGRRPCKKLDQPASGMIYFLPRPSLTLSEQTQKKRDRIRPPKSGPPRGGKRREVVQSPPDFPNRGRIRPSKNRKKKDEKKEVRNTFRHVGYVFNR